MLARSPMSNRQKSLAGSIAVPTSAPRTPARRKFSAKGERPDAAALLIDEHRAIDAMLVQALRGRECDPDALLALVDRICEALALHAALEEEIVYPAFARALDDPEGLLIAAEIEHDLAKRLVAEVRTLSADDERLLPTLRVLHTGVQHHVREEETRLFPAARRAGVDLAALAAELVARRAVLTGGSGPSPAAPDPGLAHPGRHA